MKEFLATSFGRKITCVVLAVGSYALVKFVPDMELQLVGAGSYLLGLATSLGGRKASAQ